MITIGKFFICFIIIVFIYCCFIQLIINGQKRREDKENKKRFPHLYD